MFPVRIERESRGYVYVYHPENNLISIAHTHNNNQAVSCIWWISINSPSIYLNTNQPVAFSGTELILVE